MVNTPEYNLARYLDGLIKPHIPSKYSISSNVEFLSRLKEFKILQGDKCLSFDVVSLFTNVPLRETIEIMANELYLEGNLNTPPMSKTSFIRLLSHATSGLFSHRNQLYQQCDGVSMGNPLAPTVANFFLGYLERKLFDQELKPSHPAFYVRYVDDIFCIFRKDVDHNSFLSEINSLHPNLSFTVEIGGDSLPFLDTEVTIRSEKITSTVYRKPTNTDVLLSYSSVAPNAWKMGLIKCFVHRAQVICSSQTLLREELAKLRGIFYKNGYPTHIFDKVSRLYFDKMKEKELVLTDSNSSDTHNNEGSEEKKNDPELPRPMVKIPFIGKASALFSRKIKRLVKSQCNLDARVVYQTAKVKDYFILKDEDPKDVLSKVVYKFTCSSDSSIDYIGYTKRNLLERVKDHLRGNTAVSDHVSTCSGCSTNGVSINNFEILKRCRSEYDTKVYEAMLIKRKDPALNRQLVKPRQGFTLGVFV